MYHLFTYVGDCRYFATGALDGVVGIWDAHEMVCVRALNKLEYVQSPVANGAVSPTLNPTNVMSRYRNPVRSVGFSFDGQLIAYGADDPFLDIVCAEL